ncbi:hypothetical protein I550_2422 [Mycobacterium intracellulare 1956]|uniref:Uncharacterized protein n=1 Tax=Mycobacterium intracellulare 1956 TaxID=1299331 RepID=X8CTD1_MYCIT|nr:hypothetical protein I550_2422 [Mycobacterium intracellulare 1956]
MSAPSAQQPQRPQIPLHAKPIAVLATQQLRDREVRRDKVVRANWVLRTLLREYGRRAVESGVFEAADDVFYLLVDELDALPADVGALVARRRAEQRRLVAVAPPTVFSGSWQPTAPSSPALAGGTPCAGSGCAAGGCAAGYGSCAPTPSTTCSPARSSSPRSPTSDTRRRSVTPPPS